MSLKYKLLKNKDVDNKQKRKDLKLFFERLITLKDISSMTKHLNRLGIEKYIIPKTQIGINETKQNIKECFDSISKKSEVHIVSDRSWAIYPEYFNEETGLTSYKPKEVFKVDIKLEYEKNNFKDSVKKLKDSSLKPLREYRKQRKEIKFIEKTVSNSTLERFGVHPKYKVYISGGFSTSETFESNYNIHYESGTFLKLAKAMKLKTVFENKTPKTNDNHVGVEIEFICKKDKYELALLLDKQGVAEYVTLKDDGSLRNEPDYPFTHELCVLATEQDMSSVMRKVIDALDEAGSKVNNRCGLHVHLDARNRDRNVMFNNLSKSQDILFAMNPRSRLDGTQSDGNRDTAYSKKINVDDFDMAISEMAGDKYYGINPLTYSRIKTIEVRIHSGSTNFNKIMNWIKILVAIVSKTEKFTTKNTKPETFVKRYNLDDDILSYIKERISKFRDVGGNHITINEAS